MLLSNLKVIRQSQTEEGNEPKAFTVLLPDTLMELGTRDGVKWKFVQLSSGWTHSLIKNLLPLISQCRRIKIYLIEARLGLSIKC